MRLGQIFLTVILFFTIGLGGYLGLKNSPPDLIIVKSENIYSDSEIKRIEKFVDKFFVKLGDRTFDPYILSENLKKNFRVIKKVVWSRPDFSSSIVEVGGTKPLLCLNNDFILGEDEKIFPCSLFSSVTIESSKFVKLSDSFINKSCCDKSCRDKSCPDYLYKFLSDVSEGLLKKYKIEYVGKNRIYLEKRSLDKKNNNIRIRAIVRQKDLLKDNPEDLLDSLGSLKNYSFKNLSRKRHVTYDLRFKNRICARFN